MKKSLLLPLSFCLCSCSDFASNYVDMWSDFFAGDLLEDDFSASSSSAQSFDNYTPPSSSSNVLNGYNPIYSSSSSVNISSSSELESSFSKMLILSSSSVRSSSSIENFINSLRDSRDGQTYKYVKIGNQVWMAENLNYETANSYCYNDNSTNCEKYGRLYEWSAALNACPIGWHLPSDADFEILVEAVGGENVAGKNLKSTTGGDLCGNGVDFGFNALPGGGYRSSSGGFGSLGDNANFWSATENYESSAYYLELYYYNERTHLDYLGKGCAYSVRCIRD